MRFAIGCFAVGESAKSADEAVNIQPPQTTGGREFKEYNMRRSWILVFLLLAGCQNVRGPLQQQPTSRIDDTRLPISEQQARGRDRLAFPDDSPSVGPSLQAQVPGVPPQR